MKALTCEMCGSTDIVKDNGLFVCQCCGTKYSVEEAKKMMVEGTVEVQGTVKVDQTANIDNYIKLAEAALGNLNYDEALEYSKKILEIDVDNINGWELKMKSSVKMDTDYYVKINDIINAGKKVIELSNSEKSDYVYSFFLNACSMLLSQYTSIMNDNQGAREAVASYFDSKNESEKTAELYRNDKVLSTIPHFITTILDLKFTILESRIENNPKLVELTKGIAKKWTDYCNAEEERMYIYGKNKDSLRLNSRRNHLNLIKQGIPSDSMQSIDNLEIKESGMSTTGMLILIVVCVIFIAIIVALLG